MSEELLLIPGPTFVSPRVREVLSRPQIGHVSAEFYNAFLEILDLTKKAFLAKSGFPIVFTGTGTSAMEASVASLIEPRDRVLVAETGYFGKRFAMINEIYGAKVDVLRAELGKHIDPRLVDRKMKETRYKALCMAHVDTSTSVSNPIEDLVKVGTKHRALTLVDAVSSVGGCELNFDDLGADVIFGASQKALGGPPGAALLMLSENALEVMGKRKSPIRSYYFNLLRWKEVMEDPKIYLATPAIQVLLAVREALREVLEEGLLSRWRRHHTVAEGIRAGVRALGFDFVAEEGYRADTVTGFWVKDGNASRLQRTMRELYKVHIARGLFENSERMLRIGHIGNVTPMDASRALSALEMSMRANGYSIKPGVAIEAIEPVFRQLGEPLEKPKEIPSEK